jgi:hypothetical protein
MFSHTSRLRMISMISASVLRRAGASTIRQPLERAAAHRCLQDRQSHSKSEEYVMSYRTSFLRSAASLLMVAIPACVLLSAVTTPAWSDVLPSATTIANCALGGTVVSDPSACSFGGGNASAVLDPFVGIQAGAAGFGVDNGAVAQVKYSFEVVGGNPGDAVLVDILVDLRTAATVDGLDNNGDGISDAFADITVLNHGTGVVERCASTDRINRDLCGVNEFAGSITMTALSGDTSNQVLLRAIAGTGPDSFGNSLSAFAFADPFIFVDPGVAGASQYSIVLSPGVANGLPTSVPEPAEWFLVAATIFLLLGRHVLANRRLARQSGCVATSVGVRLTT